jgi:hypothetical protein
MTTDERRGKMVIFYVALIVIGVAGLVSMIKG